MIPYDHDVFVHPRVWQQHRIPDSDVLEAWRNSLGLHMRPEPRNQYGNDEYLTVGFDHAGREIEIIATYDKSRGTFLIYHANRPATKGFIIEYEAIGGMW